MCSFWKIFIFSERFVQYLEYVYSFWNMFTVSGRCLQFLEYVYNFWIMFTVSGLCLQFLDYVYSFWKYLQFLEVFTVSGSIYSFWKYLQFLEVFTVSGSIYSFWKMCSDSVKCFNFLGIVHFLKRWIYPLFGQCTKCSVRMNCRATRNCMCLL